MSSSTYVRRNQLKIITDILDYTDEPRRPTHIMNQMNLNYSQLKKYLVWLTENGLLERVVVPFHGFQTSQKGLEFGKMLDNPSDKTEVEIK